MNENIIKDKVKELAYLNVVKFYIFDNIKDVVSEYKLVDGIINSKQDKNLTEYLELIKTVIKEEYVSLYMNSISLPKLQKAKQNGEEIVKFNYVTLNNENYTNLCSVEEIDGSNYVFMVQFKTDSSNTNESNNEKYDNLINAISDSILKIQNVFNMNMEKVNAKNIEEYINSIFSKLYSNNPELKKSINKTAANVSGREKDTILIVDDDNIMRSMIKKVFKNDTYKLQECQNGKEAIEYLEANENKGISEASDHVIGIFLDLTMPVLDGFAVLDYLSKKNYINRLPVIIISGDYEKETKARVYNYNIADMLEKPFDFDVVRHRISNFINLYKSSNSLHDLIGSQNSNLKDIINPYVESYKFDYADKIENVNKFIKLLGNKVIEAYPEFELTSDKIEKMADASCYYDIGIGSVPKVSLKKSNLSKYEYETIKNYPLFSAQVINYVLSLTSDELYKSYALNIASYYHENYNGSGYPKGLKENDIPIEAQIASICINYVNLLGRGKEAINLIVSKSGVMFNPKLILCFKSVISEKNL